MDTEEGQLVVVVDKTDYPLSVDALTYAEWDYIKRQSGYMPGTAMAGIEGGDAALVVALAVVAAKRAGVELEPEQLAAKPYGAISAEVRGGPDLGEVAAGPPAAEPAAGAVPANRAPTSPRAPIGAQR